MDDNKTEHEIFHTILLKLDKQTPLKENFVQVILNLLQELLDRLV